MLIGAHVDTGDPLQAAADRKADLVQFFLSNPQGFEMPKTRDDADALRASGIPVYVHAPYLVNVAAAAPRIRHPSRQLLQKTCTSAATIGAAGVIVHGGFCAKEEEPTVGFERWRATLEQLETEVPVLIENTAGGTNAMARHFDILGRLWERIANVDVPLGFCLDTCHTHASGEEMIGSVERVLAIVGRIDLLHCNDSKDTAGSGRDRHENLGVGRIDPDVLVEVVRTADAPVVCETPGGADGQGADIAWLRERV